MCLGVPGKIVSINEGDNFSKTGKIDFSGVIKEINLAYVPEANVNDYVIVHAGFAISILDESEANEVFKYLNELDSFNKENIEELV